LSNFLTDSEEEEEEVDEEEAEETQRELDELGLGDIEGARLLSPASVNEIASAIGPGKINKKGRGNNWKL